MAVQVTPSILSSFICRYLSFTFLHLRFKPKWSMNSFFILVCVYLSTVPYHYNGPNYFLKSYNLFLVLKAHKSLHIFLVVVVVAVVVLLLLLL